MELNSILLSASSREPTSGPFIPIRLVERVYCQSENPFRTSVRALLNGGELPSFQSNEAGCLVRTVKNHPELVIPHSLQSQLLHL